MPSQPRCRPGLVQDGMRLDRCNDGGELPLPLAGRAIAYEFLAGPERASSFETALTRLLRMRLIGVSAR